MSVLRRVQRIHADRESMAQRALPVFAVIALAATLWVVPSIGSQGMGTMGERFAHADRSLIEQDAVPATVHAVLRDADIQVEATLAR